MRNYTVAHTISEREIVIYVYMTPNNNTYMLKWLFEDMRSVFSCKAKCACVAAQLKIS